MSCHGRRFWIAVWLMWAGTRWLSGQPFHFPTANRALLQPGAEEQFFVGTTGHPWMTGTFGCVRSGGHQLHEGLDIRCLLRDRRGEPADPVLATADGTVAYLNPRPSLSNYGNYVVLRHQIEGIEIYSLYAHLREIQAGLRAGLAVKAGQPLGVMGRTSNTRERISLERAHVHFELDLLVNDRFPAWFQRAHPGERNDHEMWNGHNLVGLDPRAVFLAQQHEKNFSLVRFLHNQTELCRVFVRATRFPWLQRCAPLITSNPLAQREGIFGYELALNFNGVAFQIVPRAASEVKTKAAVSLLSVNAAEAEQNPCRRLVVQRGSRWELANNGLNFLNLLTY